MGRIKLGPFDSQYLEQARTWRNNPIINRWCRQNDYISDMDQSAWFRSQATDPKIKMYAVKLGNLLVGVAGLTSIDTYNRKAEFSLYIGPEHQGKGFAKEALAELLDHGFSSLGLNLIWGETFQGNMACHLFQSLGFRQTGFMPKSYWKDGKFINSYFYAMLKEDWLGQVPNTNTDLVDADGVVCEHLYGSDAALPDSQAPRAGLNVPKSP